MGFFKQNLLFSNCFLFSIQDSNSPDYEPDDDNEDDKNHSFPFFVNRIFSLLWICVSELTRTVVHSNSDKTISSISRHFFILSNKKFVV